MYESDENAYIENILNIYKNALKAYIESNKVDHILLDTGTKWGTELPPNKARATCQTDGRKADGIVGPVEFNISQQQGRG